MAELELLHEASDTSYAPQIIFVHGLCGHPRKTWMLRSDDENTLWPLWVGRALNCSVWLLSYDAALSKWRDGAMPLSNQGATVLDRLAAEPRISERGFILVGHSMGGLVIKTALIDSITLGVNRYSFFHRHLRGVVFVATPHFGSHLAVLARWFQGALRTNEPVGDMKLHDAHLTKLNTQFRAQHKQLGFAVRSFCEAQGVAFRRLFGLRMTPAIRVVDSADPHVDGDSAIYLPADHFSICKPDSPESQIHKSMIEFVDGIRRRESNPFYVAGSTGLIPHTSFESEDKLITRISDCTVEIVAGRIGDQPRGSHSVVVLPCNEYFDDKCATDPRTALGSYVSMQFDGGIETFMELVRTQCRATFGAGKQRKKTDDEFGDSYGVGKCLLLERPLGYSGSIALVSTATQRPGEGLVSQVSNLFPAIEDLASRMADARLSEAIMPILGAGHGGLNPSIALVGLLLAIAQVARRPSSRLKHVTIVVHRKDSQSQIGIDPWKIRQALSLIATDPTR